MRRERSVRCPKRTEQFRGLEKALHAEIPTAGTAPPPELFSRVAQRCSNRHIMSSFYPPSSSPYVCVAEDVRMLKQTPRLTLPTQMIPNSQHSSSLRPLQRLRL
jgi:hypothetical protein